MKKGRHIKSMAMVNDQQWKTQDQTYHEDAAVVDSFDQRIIEKYRLEHKYFTLDKWIGELKTNEAKYVLDFGCATGTASLSLLKNGIQAVSLDASYAMLKKVQQKAKGQSLQAKAIMADGEQMPFKDGAFDGVICMGVLHHIPNILKGLQEQLRVLKEGGVIFISEPFEPKPWISYPYEIFKESTKFLLNIFKGQKLTTPERALTPGLMQEIEQMLAGQKVDYEIKYLVYWPHVFGNLPEKLSLALLNFINRCHRAKTGDVVLITIRKKRT
jgi:ubiquinone/menaquinone biosynthesis C-methylase UbiE